MTSNPKHLIRGWYRRIYSNARTGRRINSVSDEAALLFWHLHFVADDFGNLSGEPDRVKADAVPLRNTMTTDRVEALLDELAKTTDENPLIRFYNVDGERFIHINDFIIRQPGGKNGKRTHRFLGSPYDDEELERKAKEDESNCIQVNPNKSGCHHKHEHEHEQNHEHKQKHHQEGESEGEAAEEFVYDLEASDSVSPKRKKAEFRWKAEVHTLWAPCGTNQFLADQTSSDNLFDDLIWPESMSDDDGKQRLGVALDLILKAKKNGTNRMAWFTKRLKDCLPLPEDT